MLIIVVFSSPLCRRGAGNKAFKVGTDALVCPPKHTPKSLPNLLFRRGCCLMGCHERVKKRTDEGVCPYRLALSLIKETPSSF
ncbi:hypothetical protein HMPREF0973_01542 [Prevotella veroralis F0319]|uniref:Uncharacterized protein n=1 Tax=Prevotella veroralis F0319 TaxID=649761 RepID=C9MPK1_9BACT|nr:hypothetical protein HMPREF0973_01542 [Prevotella veroralis F0319]